MVNELRRRLAKLEEIKPSRLTIYVFGQTRALMEERLLEARRGNPGESFVGVHWPDPEGPPYQ